MRQRISHRHQGRVDLHEVMKASLARGLHQIHKRYRACLVVAKEEDYSFRCSEDQTAFRRSMVQRVERPTSRANTVMDNSYPGVC